MRKSSLLVSTAVAAVCVHTAPSRAQVVVSDPPALVQLVDQLNQLQEAYKVYMGIFGSLVRDLDPNTYAQQLLAAINPMPGSANIAQMLTGSGGFGGLTGIANQFQQSNTFYMPQSLGAGDFNATMLQRSGNTLAGVQAMAQTSLASLESHIQGLAQIQQQLSVATSQSDLTAINGRLQAEQANLTAQAVQAQSINTMMAAQQQQYLQMELQKQRQDADALAASVSDGGVDVVPPIPPTQIPAYTGG